ncbi:MAG: UDP-N-acetylmuramate--L-alanine ligase, partial [Planctomycetota bacterium]
MKKKKRAHFIGIGGIGMSGMAMIFQSQGCRVTGSDSNPASPICQDLRQRGIRIWGDSQKTLPETADLAIYTKAIPQDHPLIQDCRKKKIPLFSYSQMLGHLMSAKIGIAVAGTHGKTTTTGLLASIFRAAGKKPGYLIGGEMRDWGGHGKWGQGAYFISEACEYKGSFLDLTPQHILINNIDQDHLDYFEDMEAIEKTFQQFLTKLSPGSALVYCMDCPTSRALVQKLGFPAISFGLDKEKNPVVLGQNLRLLRGGLEMDIYRKGKYQGTVTSTLLGTHNCRNILGAYAMSQALGISFEAFAKGVGEFKGVARRLEKLGEVSGVEVLDDYGHHPAEIKAVYEAIRQRYRDKKVFLVFQPHQYSRTYQLFSEFAVALAEWDEVILPEIYSARDSQADKMRVSSRRLSQEINLLGGKSSFIPNFYEISHYLCQKAQPGDVIL